MRFSWIRVRGVVVVSAAIMALQGAPVLAQFVPYGASPSQNFNPYQDSTARPAQQTQPQYSQTQQYAQPQYAQPQYGQPQHAQPPYGQKQYTPISRSVQPQYTAMAFQGNGTRTNVPNLSPSPEPIASGQATQADPALGYAATPAVTNYESYPVQGGYAPDSSGAYNTFDNGCAPYASSGSNCGTTCNTGCDTGCCDVGCSPCGGRRWFGGFYSLYMQRGGNARIPLGYTTTAPVWGNYPTDAEIGLTTADVDTPYQAGAEIRFGSTFGRSLGCGPVWGWEVAYWGLSEETATARLDDVSTFASDGTRTYGMVDFRGLEVDMGSGFYRPVNSYFDYGMPQADHTNDPDFIGTDLEIRSIVARNTFSAQSVEINLLRLPMFGGGAIGGGSCGAGGCNTGGCGGGSLGCRAGCGIGRRGGIAPFCGPRHSLTTLMGVRFMRFDEDFSLRSDLDLVDTATSTTIGNAFLDYDIEADNQLVGFQLGCNGIYRLGCQGRWALQYGTSFGVYGNRMEVSQRFDLPTSGVATRYSGGTQANFDVNSSKTDVAFLGELRAGGSYQYSCNWRLYGGWRALAASGVALTTGQIPNSFITPAQVGYINSSGSLFLHGLQAGVECTY